MGFYVITRDGETVAKAATLADCYRFIIDRVPYASVDHSLVFGGWDIVNPLGESVRWADTP